MNHFICPTELIHATYEGGSLHVIKNTSWIQNSFGNFNVNTKKNKLYFLYNNKQFT